MAGIKPPKCGTKTKTPTLAGRPITIAVQLTFRPHHMHHYPARRQRRSRLTSLISGIVSSYPPKGRKSLNEGTLAHNNTRAHTDVYHAMPICENQQASITPQHFTFSNPSTEITFSPLIMTEIPEKKPLSFSSLYVEDTSRARKCINNWKDLLYALSRMKTSRTLFEPHIDIRKYVREVEEM